MQAWRHRRAFLSPPRVARAASARGRAVIGSAAVRRRHRPPSRGAAPPQPPARPFSTFAPRRCDRMEKGRPEAVFGSAVLVCVLSGGTHLVLRLLEQRFQSLLQARLAVAILAARHGSRRASCLPRRTERSTENPAHRGSTRTRRDAVADECDAPRRALGRKSIPPP